MVVRSFLRRLVSHIFWLVLYNVIIFLSDQYVGHLILQFSAYVGGHGMGCTLCAIG